MLQEESTTWKVFLAQFMNTSVIVFAISVPRISNSEWLRGWVLQVTTAVGVPIDMQPFEHQPVEFEVEWYKQTGADVCMTLILNSLVGRIKVNHTITLHSLCPQWSCLAPLEFAAHREFSFVR